VSEPGGNAIGTSAEQAFYDGVMAQVAGDLARAEECYRRALAADQRFAAAHHHLALVLLIEGRNEEAVVATALGLELCPEAAALWRARGAALHGLGRHDAAVAAAERALAIDSPNFEAETLLGAALLALDRPSDALPHFESAIQVAPGQSDAYSNLGTTLLALDRAAEAVEACQHALALDAANFRAMRNLGAAFLALDREDDALTWLRQAGVGTPDDADIHYNIGIASVRLGRLADAVTALDRAIALRPREPRFYRTRGFLGGDASHLSALEAMADEVEHLPVPAQIELHFALGKAQDELGRHERAIQHWILGNALMRQTIAYDEAATLDLLDRPRRVFTAELMRRWSGRGHPSRGPVFIVGMPRSGSTLIEQILASHPGIFGAGETYFLPELIADRPDLEAGADGAEAALRDLGAAYEHRLGSTAPESLRVTDKMLANFRFVGLIHLALPNARIIHARRDPLDTCLSCFSELFSRPLPYSYELGELGRYHRAYRALMDHWRRVLPDGIMLDVDYEAMISDTEAEARRIVAHLGLDWDDACLAFHQTRRPVRTASLVQVRQPVYRSSVGRAARYAAYLQPLIAAL
jgi:tetratricopeptide (TPR) repeat protein